MENMKALAFAGWLMALATTTQAQPAYAAELSIPPEVRSALDQKYRQWKLFDEDAADPHERQFCDVKPGWGSLVRGDFDGDGKPDFGLLIETGSTVRAIAYLSRASSKHLFDLYPVKPTDRGYPNYLSIAPKGTLQIDPLRNRKIVARADGVSLIYCESNFAIYFFEGGKFRHVVEGD